MRKMLILFLLIFSGMMTLPYLTRNLLARQCAVGKAKFSHIPPSLVRPVQILLRCPSVVQLLAELNKQGEIGLSFSALGENGANAMWIDERREIVINSSKRRGVPDFIRSIVFEMHNAAAKPEFYELDQKAKNGLMTKEAYVRAVEKLEHQNALKAKKLIDWAILKGYFPPETAWNLIEDFEQHYKFQKHTGHSHFIAVVYDSLVETKTV